MPAPFQAPPAIHVTATKAAEPAVFVECNFSSTFSAEAAAHSETNLAVEASQVIQRARAECRAARIKAFCFSDIAQGALSLRSGFRTDSDKIRDDKAKMIFLSTLSPALKELSSSLDQAQNTITDLRRTTGAAAVPLSNEVRSLVLDAKLILSLIDHKGELKSLLTSTNDSSIQPYISAANRFAPIATSQILSGLLLLDSEGKPESERQAQLTTRLATLYSWDKELGGRVAKLLPPNKASTPVLRAESAKSHLPNIVASR